MYIYTNLRLYWQNKVAELAFMFKGASMFTVKCKFGSFYYIFWHTFLLRCSSHFNIEITTKSV